MNLRHLFAAALGAALLALASGAWAGDAGMPPFPALTGPVVDGANLLSADDQYAITQKLAAYDRGSGNQVVVVTVPTLNGYPIEQWGYQLGRHWGIGEKGKNTGAILIVDSGEKKLRIEVGYGLEGTLTDAVSDNIIRNIIVPK
ncbi:MAG TPA: TPM domain-containing protein, partial [Gammaproteobacteria bacterium]|nr:TPM domain-containing protein [Gammaproteobacteria bacterium]